jgi:hypothetical protein
MSTENQAEEQALNAPEEAPVTPETQETVQQEQAQPEVDTSKLFSKAYNEGKSKAEKDFINQLRSLGIEDAETLEDGLSQLSNTLKPKEESKSEVEELRKLLEETQKRAEDAENEYQAYVQEMKLETEMDSSLNGLTAEGNLTLKPEHLKNLFYMEYEIEEENGQFFATRNGIPVLDGQGNRQSVGDVLKTFAKENKYVSPRAMGAGGGTADTPSGNKPSRAEFRSLLQSKSADAQARAAELYTLAKETGWAD